MFEGDSVLAWSIVAAGLVLLAVVAFVPGMVAAKRGCKSRETIRTIGVAGIIVPPLWIVAIIWAFLGKRA